MSKQKERDEFIAIVTQEGLPLSIAQRLMRYSTTLQRLAEASCNGDWPADNGERKTKLCPECQMGWAPSSFRKGVCPDCRTAQLVNESLPEGFGALLNGDPRGCVVKITVPSGRTNDWGKEGVCVP